MTVNHLEKAVSELTPEELAKFTAWFEEFLADQWDRQIEADAAAGKLDRLAKEAAEDFEAGRCTEVVPGLPGSEEKPREIPWAGLFHDPDMVPAKRIDEELATSWADDLDRDRR